VENGFLPPWKLIFTTLEIDFYHPWKIDFCYIPWKLIFTTLDFDFYYHGKLLLTAWEFFCF